MTKQIELSRAIPALTEAAQIGCFNLANHYAKCRNIVARHILHQSLKYQRLIAQKAQIQTHFKAN